MIMRSRDKDYLASVASIWNLYRSAYDFIVVCDDIDMVSHPVQFPNISRLYIAITREHRNVIAIQHITIESTRPKKEEPPTQGSFQGDEDISEQIYKVIGYKQVSVKANTILIMKCLDMMNSYHIKCERGDTLGIVLIIVTQNNVVMKQLDMQSKYL
eukprot:620955_1